MLIQEFWYVKDEENRVILPSLCFLKVPLYCPFCRYFAPWEVKFEAKWLAVVLLMKKSQIAVILPLGDFKTAVILPSECRYFAPRWKKCRI